MPCNIFVTDRSNNDGDFNCMHFENEKTISGINY